MKRKIVWAGWLILAVLVFAGAAGAEGIREGEWKMTVVSKMEGMEKEMAEAKRQLESLPPEQRAMMDQMMGRMDVSFDVGEEGVTTTVTQCISQTDPVPEIEGARPECDVTHSVAGGTVSFEAVCPEGSSSGQLTYEEDSMTGTVTSRQEADGRVTRVTMDISGEYVGPCGD